VGGLVDTVALAAVTFAATNTDGLLVLTMLFVSSHLTALPRPWQIWTGQYLGLGVLVAVSVVAARWLTGVPNRYVGLLGLVPLALGVRGLVTTARARHDNELTAPAVAAGVMSVTAVTIANGSDNVAVYIALFHGIPSPASAVTITVFAVFVAGWCTLASWLGAHRKIVPTMERYGHWIIPATFVVVGLLILIRSGVLGRIW
jgi:cadmium resistance protein CadD (predicted permease)